MPDSQRDNEDSLLIWGIPPELKARFKAKCAAEKRTMKEVILEFMDEHATSKC